MARDALLRHVRIPAAHVHRMRGERKPAVAAVRYEDHLRAFFDAEPGAPTSATFDLVLLGLGTNGHTASLFPGQPAVHENERWVVSERIEEVGDWRMTLTPAAINAARSVAFVVSGEEKAEVLRQVVEGPNEPDRLPAQIVRPASGDLTWLIDEAAASRLTKTRA